MDLAEQLAGRRDRKIRQMALVNTVALEYRVQTVDTLVFDEICLAFPSSGDTLADHRRRFGRTEMEPGSDLCLRQHALCVILTVDEHPDAERSMELVSWIRRGGDIDLVLRHDGSEVDQEGYGRLCVPSEYLELVTLDKARSVGALGR